jgi:proteic killer suppression protein
MAIRSFKDVETERFFYKGKVPHQRGWAGLSRIVKRKLDMLDYASELKDLFSPPQNRLEALFGNLQGCYSIRINDQWRVVFKWDKQPYDVRIMDYH